MLAQFNFEYWEKQRLGIADLPAAEDSLAEDTPEEDNLPVEDRSVPEGVRIVEVDIPTYLSGLKSKTQIKINREAKKGTVRRKQPQFQNPFQPDPPSPLYISYTRHEKSGCSLGTARQVYPEALAPT